LNTENILEIKGISKSFPGVKALDKVGLTVKKGEIHALVGENGAGKSTMMKILSGVYTADEGEIIFQGNKVKIKDPHHSEALGISIVYQELSNFPAMSVAENICVGAYPRKKSGSINFKETNRRAQALLNEFSLNDLKPRQLVRLLSIGRQQVVEILKATSRNAKLLILDEPTSALTEKETLLLFSIMRKLRESGVSIIYISHRLDEIFEICDRVSILRDGKFIKMLNIAETNKSEVVRYMVGRDVAYNYGAHTSEAGSTLFEARNIKYKSHVKDVSFSLKAGEVLGLAGLEGAGRTELVECIFGALKKDAGQTLINGTEVIIKNPVYAKKNGMAYITKERKSAGLFLQLTVGDNISAGNLRKFSKSSCINFKKVNENSHYYMKRFSIKTPSLKNLALSLSGGNQQKVLLASWFTSDPKILIVDEPTRGIDVGTKEEIHKLIRELAKNGAGIIMISSDLPEILGASDRILVMYEGMVTGMLDNHNITEEQIIRLASNEVG